MRRADLAEYYPWFVVFLMFCGYAASFLDRSLVNVASAPIKHDLGLSDTQFGLVSGTSFVILYSLCGIPLGRLADRVDRRGMIALGILFWTAMTAVCGLAGSFPMFLVGRIGVGLGEASLVPAGMSLIGGTMPRHRTGRAVAIFIMGATVGNATALIGGGYLLTRLTRHGPTLMPLVGSLAPWQMLFLIACVPGLVIAALTMSLREPDRTPPVVGERSGLRAAWVHIGTHRGAYGFLTAATCCMLVLTQAQSAWAPLFFVRHFGLAPGESAILVGTLFLLSAPTGQFFGGWVSDRLQASGVGGAQNLVMALGLTLALLPAAIFCTTDLLWLSKLAYPAFTFLIAAASPNALAALQLVTPARHRGIASALFMSIVTLIGIGAGPATVGLLTDHLFGDERALGFSLLTVILAGGLAGALLAWAGRRPFAQALGVASSRSTSPG